MRRRGRPPFDPTHYGTLRAVDARRRVLRPYRDQPTGRTVRGARARFHLLAAGAAGVTLIAACGGDDDVTSAPASSTVPTPSEQSVVPTSAATTEPPDTESTTAVTTATTTTSTTVTSTTVTPEPLHPAGGWIEAGLPTWALPPCCADQWHAPGPSPQLSDDTLAPFADGVYYADIAGWSPDAPDQVALRVLRFERCDTLLDEQSTTSERHYGCDESTVTPDDVGVRRSESSERSFELGTDMTVGVVGADSADWFASGVRTFTGDGAALTALWTGLDADYETWVRPYLRAGIDPFDLAIALRADAGSPFTTVCELADDYTPLVWSAPDGPRLMFEELAHTEYLEDGEVLHSPRTPAQLLDPAALEIVDGRPTLYLYQAFVP